MYPPIISSANRCSQTLYNKIDELFTEYSNKIICHLTLILLTYDMICIKLIQVAF